MSTWEPQWPRAPFKPVFAPGGGPERARKAWGESEGRILDIGALRMEAGEVRILMSSGWAPFDEGDRSLVAHANRHHRYGPGHSFGGALLQGHGRVLRAALLEGWRRTGRPGEPTEMDYTDAEFNPALAAELLGVGSGSGPTPTPVQGLGEVRQKLETIEGLVRQILAKSLVVLAVLSLTGCSALRTLVPGGVTAADAEWSGVKSGPPVSIVGAIDPRAATVAALLEGLGQEDPVGVLLPLTLIGETKPRWVLCADELAAKCREIPLNAKVKFSGQPIGPGLLWKPSRLVADDFND